MATALADIIAVLKKEPEVTVLSALIDIQEQLHYLPPESIPAVAELTGLSVNDVYTVATFYTHFRFKPPGEHVVEACWGPSCHLRGAPEVMAAIEKAVGATFDSDTPDGKFTLRRLSCAGACGHGPVVVLDHKMRGNIGPADVTAFVEQARKSGGEHH